MVHLQTVIVLFQHDEPGSFFSSQRSAVVPRGSSAVVAPEPTQSGSPSNRPRQLSRSNRAHLNVCLAVDRILKFMLKLDQLFMENHWYERFRIFRSRLQKAVVNLITINENRSAEVDNFFHVSRRFYYVARRIIEMYTPLQDLEAVLQQHCLPHFEPVDHYRHAIWLHQKRVPAVLIDHIFDFAGINLFIHATLKSVTDAYRVIRRNGSYHPLILYDRLILRTHRGDRFHNSGTMFLVFNLFEI